ncbi:MAG: glycosyltransferase, partial [Gemmataceae bacterium]
AYPDGWAAVRLAKNLGVPAVLQVHGSDVLLLDRFPARLRRTVDALQAADGVVAVSQDLAHRLQRLGISDARIRVIYDGVDTAVFQPGPKDAARDRVGVAGGDPVVLFVGNLVPVKGVDLLLKACARLAAERFPVHLVVIGQGPLRGPLEKLARELGITDSVRFAGSLPQDQLPDWYRAADLFALPSHSEGVPNVLLEASACGTPWVATRVGGIPEIADRGQSRLIPPNDAVALAQALRESLTNRANAPPVSPRRREDAVTELELFLSQRLPSASGAAPRVTACPRPWPAPVQDAPHAPAAATIASCG